MSVNKNNLQWALIPALCRKRKLDEARLKLEYSL